MSSLSSLSSCSSGASGSSVSFETAPPSVTATSVRLAQSGRSVAVHDMGMRDMKNAPMTNAPRNIYSLNHPPLRAKAAH